MIQIGNQTAFSAATPVEPFEYAVANGFDAFEWFPDKKPNGAGWDESDLDESLRSNIRETGLTRGMRFSVHARWQANPLQPDSHPVLLKDLELAQTLGAALLNIHLYRRAGLEAYVEAITPLVRCVAEAGLQLSIENTPEHTPEDFNELFARLHSLETVPTNHVGMCLDLGHANLCAATRNNYLQYLDRLSPQVPIVHLHLHENWGDTDSHLPLFTGPAGQDDSGIRGLLERVRRRNYSGSIILEQWPQPPALLISARQRLINFLYEGGMKSSTVTGQSSPSFPLAPALSPGERETSSTPLDKVNTPRPIAAQSPTLPLPAGTAVELRGEFTLGLRSLSPRGTSGERVGETGNPIKPSSSPPSLSFSFVGREGEGRFRFRR